MKRKAERAWTFTKHLLYARPRASCIVLINSLNPCSNSSAGEETEARGGVGTCPRLATNEYRTGIQIQACLTSVVTLEEGK